MGHNRRITMTEIIIIITTRTQLLLRWPRSHVQPVGVLNNGEALCAVWRWNWHRRMELRVVSFFFPACIYIVLSHRISQTRCRCTPMGLYQASCTHFAKKCTRICHFLTKELHFWGGGLTPSRSHPFNTPNHNMTARVWVQPPSENLGYIYRVAQKWHSFCTL